MKLTLVVFMSSFHHHPALLPLVDGPFAAFNAAIDRVQAMEGKGFYFISGFSFLFLLLLSIFYSLKRRTETHPPSPASLPIIGHLHLIARGPIHRALQQVADHYGPIVSLRFGSRPVVVISSPSLVEECFTKNDIILANRPRLLAGKHLNYDYTTIGTAPYGDLWRNLRRIAALEILSTNRLNMFLNIRLDEVRQLLKHLFNTCRQDYVKVEMKSRLSELSFNIIMRMVSGKWYFGEKVENPEEARCFRDIISQTFALSGAPNMEDYLPFLRWFGIEGTEKRMLELRQKTDVFVQGLINQYRSQMRDSNLKGAENKTMIHSLLSLQESEPECYTDEVIKGLIMILVLAGTDTSALTMEWAMALLINHPSVLKNARVELDNNIGQSRMVEEADLPNLPYVQSIINESLRLFPTVPLLVPHESSEDCIIGGYNVPRGTMLLVNAWAIHRNPEIWHDPTSFRPERFGGLECEGYKLLPFGMGRRACPGAGLANRVVGWAVAALIQCFEWEKIGDEQVNMTEGTGLNMPKLKPLEAMCKSRASMDNVLSQL